MKKIIEHLSRVGRITIAGAPEGFDALVLGRLAGAKTPGTGVIFVARDDLHMARMADALAFFSPKLECLEFPAWDCLPYDRVSPKTEIAARRIDTLTRLLEPDARLVLTTVSAVLQRVPPRDAFEGAVLHVRAASRLERGAFMDFLDAGGYGNTGTVMEAGEYAVRGGIVDVFPPGLARPLRLDFFGDELESIRTFDPSTQRTTGTMESMTVKPVSEVPLNDAAISRFRTGYRALFGAPAAGDVLYEAVSAGRRALGMEHWLPLFHDRLETVLDYAPGAVVILDHQADEAVDARLGLIDEYYQARTREAERGSSGPPYNPVPPDRLYLSRDQWDGLLEERATGQLSPFAAADDAGFDAGGRPGRDFADARAQPGVNVFEAVRGHVEDLSRDGTRVVITAASKGSRDRLASVLAEHGLAPPRLVEDWAGAMEPGGVAIAVVGLERGFKAPDLAVITERDILGERLGRPRRARVRAGNFIAEASALGQGDLVVHVEHGIGRYDGLVTIMAAGGRHDCLRLIYAGGDKLFLPVENIDLISRYGSERAGAQLDRLGSASWQARKARLKERVRDMAEDLIKVAAARALKSVDRVVAEEGPLNEFSARFPYAETEDQASAIAEVVHDLGRGRPADRLICGDVGFGKTEVALRAAFVVAYSGRQVAVVVPTTLLCRQHYLTFTERFEGFPIHVEQLSRLVQPKRAREVKAGLKDGTVDIVIGTHTLLAKDVAFRDLGLLVVDEEQHFGVTHKEKLKRLKSDVHVLTMTATPIPRTLQLALTGVREMSLIATPPVDRLAVRTFVLPFDPVIVRQAILRERFRGGQTFYVCPRIADLDVIARRLAELVPEVSMVTAHGRLPARDLESAISAFYDGAYDVLLSTDIIESGLDLPRVNTIIIHRADRFGLAQLYQLRGRVGRSNIRAYAYLTLPERGGLSGAAEKRLQIMQTLDTLGAGFTLASHDLDIRGAGNLLGGEQSGHIREVGIELYQRMLEEAVAEARGEVGGGGEDWSPEVSLNMAVLIPDTYVPDLTVRLGLYRRLAALAGEDEIGAFAAELCDRFGPLPEEADNLLRTVAVKGLCKMAGVAKVEAGPKGATVVFREGRFTNPAGLVDFIQAQAGTVRLRPDHTLVYRRAWEDGEERLAGVRRLLENLAAIPG